MSDLHRTVWGDTWGSSPDRQPFVWKLNHAREGQGVMLAMPNSSMEYLSDWSDVADYLNDLMGYVRRLERTIEAVRGDVATVTPERTPEPPR